MPVFLTAIGVALSLILALFPSARDSAPLGQTNWLTLATFLVLMSLFGVALQPLGFLLSTSIFLLIGFVLLGERRVARLAVIPLGVALGFWAVMDLGLGVYISPLPEFASP